MSNWSGEFRSELCKVGGKITVKNLGLTNMIKDDPVEIILTYHQGEVHRFSTNVNRDFIHAVPGLDDEEITLRFEKKSSEIIKGTYSCSKSYDHGEFQIYPDLQVEIENDKCLIM